VTFAATATDNCGGVIFGYTYNSGSVFLIGTTTVTAFATDVNGNVSNCIFDIEVTDNEAPAIVCPATISVDNDPGLCGAAVTFNATATDNCAGVSVAYSHASGSVFSIGMTTVTASATDVNGNVSTCTFDIEVNDNEAPALTCPADINVLSAPGKCGATVPYSAVVTDNCPGVNVLYSPGSFSVLPVGVTVVTVTATDSSGNPSNCTFTVTVADGEAPTITCPANISVNTDPGHCGAAVPFAASASDNCTSVTVAYDHASGSVFGTGSTLVTATATDASGNTAACTFSVTVTDQEAPQAICQAQTLVLAAGGTASLSVAALDNGSSDNCGNVSLAVLGQTQFGCADAGMSYPVALVVADAHGNADTCSTTVTITDPNQVCNQGPVAICQNITVPADANCEAAVSGAAIGSASFDPENGALTYQLIPAGPYALGIHTVQLVVTDLMGATDTCSAVITVVDNTPPVALCQNIVRNLNGQNEVLLDPAMLDDGSYDNCGAVTLSLSTTRLDCGNLGLNSVVLTVTDSAGLSAACTATVEIHDTIPPVALCQPVTIYFDANGTALLTPQMLDNGSYDNCAIVSMVTSATNYTCAMVGSEPIGLTVTDAEGNSATCYAPVTAIDSFLPVAVCHDTTLYLDAFGVATVSPNDLVTGVNDNCGIRGITMGTSTFACAAIGQQTETITVTDYNNQTATCTTVITIVDSSAPVITCTPTLLLNAFPGQCGASAQLLPQASAQDNCGILSLGNNAPATLPVGVTTVTWTAVDNGLNSASCTTVVTVRDNQPPTFAACPNNLVATAGANCQAVVNWTPPVPSDNCGITSLVASHQPGTTFSAGTTTVTYTAYDGGSNSAVCTFNVTVQVAPMSASTQIVQQITCNGNSNGAIKVNVSGGCAPYTYLWSNGQTTQTATGLGAGTYTVTVTSSGGSTVVTSGSLTQPAVLNVTAVITKATCASATNGSINQAVSGGAAPWAYLWSNGATSQDIFNLAPGTYTCTTTDARGCQQVRTWVVGTQMVADAGPTTVTRCANAACTTIGTGSSGSYSYTWYYFSNNGVPVGNMARINAGYTPTLCVANTVTRLYYIEVFQSSTGCRLRDSIWVQVLPANHPSCAAASNREIGQAGEATEVAPEVTVYPNPFRESVNIDVALPVAEKVELEIVSIEGKYIRRFAGEPLDAGLHQFKWDGTDGSGRPVANGMYIYRLRVGQQVLHGRIEYLR
jgi:hypothetical protein